MSIIGIDEKKAQEYNKKKALYSLDMMKSSSHLAVYEDNKEKKKRFLERVDYHSKIVKAYLDNPHTSCIEC